MPTRTDPVTLTLRRHVTPQDPAIVRRLVTDTGFFSLAEVAVAVELVEQRLATGVASGYEFLLAESRGQVIGYTCFGLIACTRGGYDLYWIAVEKSCQRQGIGRQLLAETERTIRQAAGRRCISRPRDGQFTTRQDASTSAKATCRQRYCPTFTTSVIARSFTARL